MKKWIATIIAMLLLFTSFAFAQENTEPDLLSRIQERGTIVIATEGNWSPWTYHD